MKICFLIILVVVISWCSQPLYSQVPPPLRTVMEVEPINSNMTLGTGMLGVGDMNNDTWPDVAVSAGRIGKTFIYFGGPGILDSIPDITIDGGGEITRGDLNGDGRMDIIIAKKDTLLIYFGKTPTPIGIDTIPDLILHAENVADGFGNSFSIGDLNNDGFDDLAVGARDYGQAQGKVYIYLGKPSPNSIPDFTANGDSIEDFYGYTVKTGDINGDKVDDLLIGADERRQQKTVDIFYGRKDWTFNKQFYNQRLGSQQLGFSTIYWFDLVDINADSIDDISFSNGDSVLFLYGRPNSISHIPNFNLTNPDTNFYQLFYGPTMNIGDINNDGKNDLAVRARPGGYAMCLIVYLSDSLPRSQPIAGRCKGFVSIGSAFINITSVGDINGDGVNDFGASAPFNAIPEVSQDGYFIIFSGDSDYVNAVSDQPTIPAHSSLHQNYPNPFNPSTVISYQLSETRDVVLRIYDLMGKEVATLVNEKQFPGDYSVSWNGATFAGIPVATGTYYYRLFLDGIQLETKKLLFVK